MPHGQLAEFTVCDSPLARDLLATPFQLEPDGTVRVPQEPGLGIEVDDAVLRRFAQVSPLPLPGRQV